MDSLKSNESVSLLHEENKLADGLTSSRIKTENSIHTINFPIIGVGASAGGLEALEQFFSHMPKDNGMAFVVIQHLDPTHIGIMPELLQRITPMKVYQASDNLKLKPNCGCPLIFSFAHWPMTCRKKASELSCREWDRMAALD
jgi:two-component system CheB/CheR fusion protein